MTTLRSHADDLRGASRLAIDATTGVTAVVEAMNRTIAAGPARAFEREAGFVTRLVYGTVQGVTRLVGAGVDGLLAQLAPLLGESRPGPERAALLAALNGVFGDHLSATGNPLAIQMSLRAVGAPTGRLVVLVHGSSMNDLQWNRNGHDHGAALARDLGVSPIYAHYNTGLHVSTNGHLLANLIERQVAEWPVPVTEVVLIGHSMGGLVARAACHSAEASGLAWRGRLTKLVCLGTPHHGAPLERAGSWADLLLGVSRYSAPLARLGKIRSAGVTDLRFGNVLDEHWNAGDRFAFGGDRRAPLPLPAGVACFAMAARSSPSAGGDGLVPIDSALGRHLRPELTLAFPPKHQCVVEGTGHVDLLDSRPAYEVLRGWLAQPAH